MGDDMRDYRGILRKISETEDIGEARRLCGRFLKMTEAAISGLPASRGPEEFLLALLQGTYQEPEAVEKLWQSISGRVCREYLAAVIAQAEPKDCSEVFRAFPDAWVFTWMDRMVLVTGDPANSVNTTEFRALLQKHRLSAGLSRPFKSISSFPEAYEEAVSTLRFLRILRPGQSMACYDDFLMLRLLDSLRKDVDPDEFCLPDIRQLQSYDKTHGTELCRTLLCYLEHAKNVAGTAAELNIHRNTVHYRVNKSMELLKDLDFSNDYIAFLLLLSLYIIEYEEYRAKLARAQGIL